MQKNLWAYVLNVIVLFMLAGSAAAFPSDSSPVPEHLQLARMLVAEIAPGDTSYRHKNGVVWKNAQPSSHYEAHTDCSGFINALLEKAESPAINYLMKTASRRYPPRAKEYAALITSQEGFQSIPILSDVAPGDIIAIKYPADRKDTGHVMLIDSIPVLRNKPTKPIVHGTQQWEVTVLDSTKSPHGSSDSRINPDGSKRNGVGRGSIRIYTDEHNKPLGYSWSSSATSVFHASALTPLLIGRPTQK